MKTLIYILSALVFIICITSCKKKQKTYRTVTVEEFSNEIAGNNIQIVDVRTPEEYQDGNISGSINIDINDNRFTERAHELLDTAKTIAIYCRSGRRSKKAADILSKQGYNIIELDGGFISWVKAGKQ